MLKQNKGAHIQCETGKDIPTQADKPGTGCEGSLDKEVFQAQGLFCGQAGHERLRRRLPCPTVSTTEAVPSKSLLRDLNPIKRTTCEGRAFTAPIVGTSVPLGPN